MKNLIYYPHFEPNQEEWFKVGLLYLDNISPIIPHSGNMFLSQSFKKVLGETDFIQIHKPRMNEANRASYLAVNELERIIQDPYSVVDIFNNANIVRTWRDSKKEITLFSEKYTGNFEDFCLENNLATPSAYGMNISRSLSHIYMTILSNEIAFQKGLSSITDNELYDDFALYIKSKDVRFNEEFETAKNTIEIAIPKNLKDIPIEKIIKLRNDDSFRQMVSAFNQVIEEYQDRLTTNREIKDLINQFKEIRSGISTKIIETGLQVVGFIIKLINLKPDPEYLDYVKDILTGARMTIKSGNAVRQFKSDNERNKFCKQYLMNLERL